MPSRRREDAAMKPADLDQHEKVLELFEKTWRSGKVRRIEQHLPAESACPERRELLEELVKIDLDYRWQQGGQPAHGDGGPLSLRPRLEDYTRLYPVLGRPEQL